MFGFRYFYCRSIAANSKILRQRRQKFVQIFPAESKPDRYENIPDLLRVVKTVWRMEKSELLALPLLQHTREADSRGRPHEGWVSQIHIQKWLGG